MKSNVVTRELGKYEKRQSQGGRDMSDNRPRGEHHSEKYPGQKSSSRTESITKEGFRRKTGGGKGGCG